jgi:hypothetical protein
VEGGGVGGGNSGRAGKKRAAPHLDKVQARIAVPVLDEDRQVRVGLLDGLVEAARQHAGVVLELNHQALLLAHQAEGALIQGVLEVEKQVLLAAQLQAHGRGVHGVPLHAHPARYGLQGPHLLGGLVVLLQPHLKGALLVVHHPEPILLTGVRLTKVWLVALPSQMF